MINSLRTIKTIALIVTLTVTPLASAEASNWYLSAGATRLSVKTDSGTTFRPEGITLRTGFRLSRLIDAEFSLSGATEDDNGLFEEFSASTVSASVKRYYPLDRQWAIYASLGGSITEFVQTIAGTELSDAGKGLAGGIGLETILYNNINISLEHIRYSYNSTDLDVSSTAVGLRWNF